MKNEEKKLYDNAKIKLKKIRELYKHIVYFFFLTPFIFLFVYYYFETLILFWSIIVIWSLSILGHYFYVYDIDDYFFGKKWEHKHLKSILEKERARNKN